MVSGSISALLPTLSPEQKQDVVRKISHFTQWDARLHAIRRHPGRAGKRDRPTGGIKRRRGDGLPGLEAVGCDHDVVVVHVAPDLGARRADYYPADLRGEIDRVNERVTGKIGLKLFKGSARVVTRESPNAVYDQALASFGESGGLFSQQASPGFIEIWSLQSRMAHRLRNG